jgi:hypothetical protein
MGRRMWDGVIKPGFSFMYIILHDQELYLQWQQLILVRNRQELNDRCLCILEECSQGEQFSETFFLVQFVALMIIILVVKHF